MINQYKEDYLKNNIHDNYNDCRFALNYYEYGYKWLKEKLPSLNIENPQNIIDRIAKYKLDDIKNPNSKEALLKRKFSDKISVYEELNKLDLENITIPCVYKEYVKELSIETLQYLDSLGGNFIIKTNHGSGWNIKYKANISNKKNILEKVNEWLKINYCYISGMEVQYRWIKPGILIQKILTEDILDWSFWCENGIIKYIGLTKKLGKNFEEYVAFTDGDGNKSDIIIGSEPEMDELNKKQKETIGIMKPIVEKISSYFKFVRVDLYYCNGKIYFGETTFTPCSGYLEFITT